MSVQFLHFSITGEYLTDVARASWVEGHPARALDILNSAFPTMAETTKIDICMGRKKLVGTNSCVVQPDNATEHNGVPFKTMAEQMAEREGAVARREREVLARAEMQADEVERIPSPWGLIRVPSSMVAWRHTNQGSRPHIEPEPGETHEQALARFEKLFPDEVERAREETRQAMTQRRLDDQIRLMGINPAAAKARLDEVLSAKPPAEPPKVDKAMLSLNGWILPNGDFYPCRYFGHIALAEAMGKTEQDAEKSWVKISNSHESPIAMQRADIYPPPGGVTQAQLDAIFVWCDRHGRTMPENIMVR